jgi:hypothetical protein
MQIILDPSGSGSTTLTATKTQRIPNSLTVCVALDLKDEAALVPQAWCWPEQLTVTITSHGG